MVKKYCLYCRLQFPDSADFCPQCGRPIEDAIRVEILHFAQDDIVSLRRTTIANGCLYCKLQLPDSADFCPQCGRPIERGFEIRPIQDCEFDNLRKEMKGKDDLIRQQRFYYVGIGPSTRSGKSPKRGVRLARRGRNTTGAFSTR